MFISKGKQLCFAWRVGDLTLFEALMGGTFDRLNWQHSREFDQNFSKKSNAPGFTLVQAFKVFGKGSAFILPVQVQICFSISYENKRQKTEMTITILLSKVVGKPKRKTESRIPFSM